MTLHINHFLARLKASWVMAGLVAMAPCVAQAGVIQQQPAEIRNYRPVFEACSKDGTALLLAIRRMDVGGHAMMLAVDPATLATRLELDTAWFCIPTDDERQKDTRYIRAIRASVAPHGRGAPDASGVIANGGVLRGSGAGSFITGDLCPSRRLLDRAFLARLQAPASPLPLALAISGFWLIRHQADFRWLREQERTGALQITWVDHSYDHPYVPGRPTASNFLLSPGVNMRLEILETERRLIAAGETPSAFFRFPGLISNAALMRTAGDYHLIVLGAGAWLARSPRADPGDVILIHLNGNEPAGLHIFSTLLDAGKLPQPFRPIDDVP